MWPSPGWLWLPRRQTSSRNIKRHHYWLFISWWTTLSLCLIAHNLSFICYYLFKSFLKNVSHPQVWGGPCCASSFSQVSLHVSLSIYIYIHIVLYFIPGWKWWFWLHCHADDKQTTSGDHQSYAISSWVDATLTNGVSLPLITLTNCLQGSVHAFTITG